PKLRNILRTNLSQREILNNERPRQTRNLPSNFPIRIDRNRMRKSLRLPSPPRHDSLSMRRNRPAQFSSVVNSLHLFSKFYAAIFSCHPERSEGSRRAFQRPSSATHK